MMNDTAGDNCMVLFINLGATWMPVTNNDPKNSPKYSQDMEQTFFRPDTGLRKLRYENLIIEKSETVGFDRKLSRTLDEAQIFILTLVNTHTTSLPLPVHIPEEFLKVVKLHFWNIDDAGLCQRSVEHDGEDVTTRLQYVPVGAQHLPT